MELFGAPPAPWDIVLGDYRWKILRGDGGVLKFRRFPTPFFPDRVSQGSATQASFPPDSRLPVTFADTSDGFGKPRHDGSDPISRYYYAGAREGNTDEGVDASAGDKAHLGPLLTRGTLAGFSPTSGVFFVHGSNLVLAATDGTNTRVYTWNASTLVFDLQATISSRVVIDGTAYRGTQSSDYAYLAFGASQNFQYSTDLATWNDNGSTEKAERFTKIDGELWRYLSGDVSMSDDGGVSPTFGADIEVGTASGHSGDFGTCNGLYNHADRVTIGKSTGLFLLAGERTTLDQNLWPDLWDNGPDTSVFSGGFEWRNHLIVQFQGGLRAISADFSAPNIGWDRYSDNDSPVYGAPSGIAGDGFHLYATCASGYLMKGVPVMSGGQIADVKWHPILYLGTTAVAAKVWNGTTGTTPEWYGLLANGQTARFVLPKTGNPLTDSRCRFCPGGVLYRPRFHGGYTTEDKLTFSSSGDGVFTSSKKVKYAYQLANATTFTDWDGQQDTTPGYRNDLATPVQSRSLMLRETYTTTDSTATPVLRSSTLHYLSQPDPLPSLEFTLDLTEGAMIADGSMPQLAPSVASERLFAMVNSGVKRCIDPYGRSVDITIPLDGYKEDAGRPRLGQEPSLFVQITARAQVVRANGSWDRVASAVDWDWLAANRTWDDLVRFPS